MHKRNRGRFALLDDFFYPTRTFTEHENGSIKHCAWLGEASQQVAIPVSGKPGIAQTALGIPVYLAYRNTGHAKPPPRCIRGPLFLVCVSFLSRWLALVSFSLSAIAIYRLTGAVVKLAATSCADLLNYSVFGTLLCRVSILVQGKSQRDRALAILPLPARHGVTYSDGIS